MDFVYDIDRPLLPAATAMAPGDNGGRYLVVSQDHRGMPRYHDSVGAPSWRELLVRQAVMEPPSSATFDIVSASSFIDELRSEGRFTYLDRVTGQAAGDDYVAGPPGNMTVVQAMFNAFTYPPYLDGLAIMVMNRVAFLAPSFTGELGTVPDPE
jgi:hypothetical protein